MECSAPSNAHRYATPTPCTQRGGAPACGGVRCGYRLLGSVADAENVAQGVWLQAAGADLSGIRGLRAWLVTAAACRSHDILKSARVRREAYVGS